VVRLAAALTRKRAGPTCAPRMGRQWARVDHEVRRSRTGGQAQGACGGHACGPALL